MKNLFFAASIALNFCGSFAQAQERTEPSANRWITMTSVCISNNMNDSNEARKLCENITQALNVMANEKIVFKAECRPRGLSEPCPGYILDSKALVTQ